MADAVRMQVRDGLEDRLRPVGLARVHGALEEMLVRVLEGLLVRARRVAGLLAREVEADHLEPQAVTREHSRAHGIERGHRKDILRPRERMRREQRVVVLAEAGPEHPQRAADDAVLEVRLAAGHDLGAPVVGVPRAAQAAVHRREHLDRVEPRPDVQLRREPHLEVAHALRLVVLGQFRRDAFERLLGLHHGDRVAEALQVIPEARVTLLIYRLAQAALGVARQLHPACARKLDQGRDAQRPVQMDVQVRLRQFRDELARDRDIRHGGTKGRRLRHPA